MKRKGQKRYLTSTEVAEMLIVTPATVRGWARKGVLPAEMTPGGHRRFLVEDVEELARQQSSAATAASLRILIVDDDRQFSDFVAEMLLNCQPEVLAAAAYDGFSAGSMVHSFAPHVVLLDLLMPGLDGFEVCRQIKAARTTQDIRVLAMTGCATPQNVERILASGAEHCLKKPLDIALLQNLLGLSDA